MKRPYDLIYFIGDSFTYAIKQADDIEGVITTENRFSQLVADNYKLEHVNQAKAGQSNQWIARTLQDDMIAYNIEDKNPLVVVSYTDTGRHEMWDNKLGEPDTCNPSQSWYKDWIMDGHDLNFSNKVSQYQINASRFLLRYLKYDFVEIFTAQHSQHLTHETGITKEKDPLSSVEETCEHSIMEAAGFEHGCFKALVDFHRGEDKASLGHLNVKGNQLVANHLIRQIDKLYPGIPV